MTEEKQTKRKKKTTPEKKTKKRKSTKKTDTGNGSECSTDQLLTNYTEQIGSILNKELTLIEAGIDWGIDLFNSIGSVVKDEVISRVNKAETSGSENSYASQEQEETYSDYSVSETEYEEQPGYPETTCVNRLPLFPGSEVYISFSINNDSASHAKNLKLSIEGFVGQTNQNRISPKGFAVTPAEKAIAPLDFDKFIITGKIPQKAPKDSYCGWVIVSGDEEFKIPVVLVVDNLG